MPLHHCSNPSLAGRARGAFLGLAIGDALGATVEFMTPDEIRHQFGVHNRICGGGWLKLKPGQVTDDTEMALALADAILSNKAIDGHAIAEAFSEWMRSKPVDIGHTVRAGIARYRRTGAVQMPPEEMSAGNGACMRCLPIALATYGLDEAEVRAASRLQAHITHHKPLSDAGTETVILMVQDFLNGQSLNRVLHQRVHPLADLHPAFAFRRRPSVNPTGFIGHTLRTVFEALIDTPNFRECLINVVNRGGDADTTGAIAGMLAGACYGEEAIPTRWLTALDDEVTRQCILHADQLIALALSSDGLTTTNHHQRDTRDSQASA